MSTVYHTTGCKYSNYGVEDTPELRAHFFYSSLVPIDDPFSVPPIPGSFEASFAKYSPRPFSDYDNKALEKSWHACFSESTWKAGSVTHGKDTGQASGDTVRTHRETTIDITVGIFKLHLVKLPALQMLPIYWSPIHDEAAVTRGTWFYKDSMYPIEPEIANRLELGYIKNRPWCQEWSDRLSSAIKEGASGDQSFLYKLYPEEEGKEFHGGESLCNSSISKSHSHTEKCLRGDFSADGRKAATQGGNNGMDGPEIIKTYVDSVACYEDSKNAFILKPGLEQSHYHILQSLSKIVGRTVGIHVVRGFDPQVWENLHPSKKLASPGDSAEPLHASTDIPTSSMEPGSQDVTDLVFVVHGIGQKLSQRVEGFHFTHAINSLRRSMYTDVSNPMVRKGLRDSLGGIAVLPINWRSTFSFEDGGSTLAGQNLKAATNCRDFALHDITPSTIPAVRSLISDVLLDIPFYMSSHKAEMTEAVVKEANRIYRLWCHNNPEFQKKGRVHIIGHSLGSALTLDILSQQPTFVTPFDVHDKIGTKHFEFDTTNLFFVGSPFGFFLLLGGGKLIPRSGRGKPGLDLDEENSKNVTGREGTYGCLAVDNLYNVMHYNDPIAYRLNAAIDVVHTTSLKKAEVPSAVANWWDTISGAAQSVTQGISTLALGTDKTNDSLISSLSSEKTTGGDFSDVEKKFHLLNDNGQVDYFLKAGDGPDIQYLNMLWAHSSYRSNSDFVRLLVTEIGREPGVRNVSTTMKAVKVIS